MATQFSARAGNGHRKVKHVQRRPAAVAAQRYRGVDRRTPAPEREALDPARIVALLVVAAIGVVALGHFLSPSALNGLGRAGALSGCLAILAAVTMFIRWRLDGRAQSWWLAAGYGTIGIAALFDAASTTAHVSFSLGALAVAFFCFLAAWHSPEVDSILSVRLAGLAVVITTAATVLAHQLLAQSLPAQRVEAAVVALAFSLLALLWLCSSQDKPWFVVALAGFAMAGAVAAAISNPVAQTAEVTCLLLLINGIVAVTALAGLQAAATRHRALALDAQRERDLVSSLRGELEAKYAETLHEMRSIALALEGGINVLQPVAADGGSRLAESLVAELERLRLLADPDHATAPMDFRLAEALQHLVALSRANGWSVTWDVDDQVVVRGRPADVAQILHGLVSNARKYAPDGPIEVSAVHAGEFVLVLVDDRGPGVRPAHRERIFERGARPEHDTEAEGHGLGLHIARRLARSLGGELWVEQHPRGGARFVLALRQAPGHDGAVHPGSHRNAS
jgi:signal transduction histidine kinase